MGGELRAGPLQVKIARCDATRIRSARSVDGPLLGAHFESLLTQSVRVHAQANQVRVAHLRTSAGERTVDLILERDDGRVVALEIKLTTNPTDNDTRHLKWLADRIGDDLVDSAIITTGKDAYLRADGIAVTPAALLTT